MIGHHGTSKISAQSILRMGFLKSNGKKWFGDGVYFFDDDQREALNWAVRVKRMTDYAVLKSNIDVRNPLRLHKATEWDEFINNKLRIQKYYDNSSLKGKVITDGYVVEFMCQQIAKLTGNPVDVVICGCNIPAYGWATQITQLPRVQTQLCVRDISRITNTEIVEEAS